jgi:hypothetical protein
MKDPAVACLKVSRIEFVFANELLVKRNNNNTKNSKVAAWVVTGSDY